MKRGFLFLCLFLVPGMVPEVFGASELLDIRHWSAPDHTRVVIDLDRSPAYEVPTPADPLILSVYLRGVLPGRKQEVSINDRIISKMRVEPVGAEGVQVALILIRPARWNIFVLKRYLDKPDRLVIDVFRPDLEEKEKAERQVSQELKGKKTKIVVLDPGHGGEDPGAIGPRGIREKDIALALAKRLQKSLDQTEEVKAFLTRRGDYFISLNDRIRIAQEYGADLFISLHTNGSSKRQTRGTSIYCLSLKGASDKAAQLLAQKENASDMVGGISLTSQRRDLDSILLDLEQTHTINESLHLGGLALSALSRVNVLQFTKPRQAGFAVLKAPNIPSILVEAAYVTHPVEERFLEREGFHLSFTQAVVSAVKKFIPLLARKEEEGPQRASK